MCLINAVMPQSVLLTVLLVEDLIMNLGTPACILVVNVQAKSVHMGSELMAGHGDGADALHTLSSRDG